MTVNGMRALILALFSVILALFILAPFMGGHGAVYGLEGGHPVEPDFFDVWDDLSPVQGGIYAVGDILCHQDSSRSFHLNGSQLPVCVRDASALAGLVAGLLLCLRFGAQLDRYAYIMIAVSFALMIADAAIQNVCDLNVFATRILTGAFCGISVAAVIDRWLRLMRPGSECIIASVYHRCRRSNLFNDV